MKDGAAPLDLPLTEVREALAADQPSRALLLLSAADKASPESAQVLGLALWRAGRTAEAEFALRRSAALGELGGRVLFGEWLCRTGHHAAAEWLADVEDALPESALKRQAQCTRAWALFLQGDLGGLLLCQHLWRTHPQPRTAVRLAQMHLQLGEVQQAYDLLQVATARPAGERSEPERLGSEAQSELPESERSAHASALAELARLQGRLGQHEAARHSLTQSHALLSGKEMPWAQAALWQAEAELLRLGGEWGAALDKLRQLRPLARRLADHELCVWLAANQAELLSVQSQDDQALLALYELGTLQGLPLALRAVRGLLFRRRWFFRQAEADLQEACRHLEPRQSALKLRCHFYLADVLARQGRFAEARPVLAHSLSSLLSRRDAPAFTHDWRDLAELRQHALLDVELAPLMQLVLDRLGESSAQAQRQQRLKLHTLGRAAVTLDGRAVEKLSAGAVLVLTYLALHPHHGRNAMQAVLFPDFERVETVTFFRVTVRELRAHLGAEILLLDDTLRHPRYQIGPRFQTSLDVTALRLALAASAEGHAELAALLEAYPGAFLENLEPPSEWADGLREELRLALNLALQAHLRRARTKTQRRKILGQVRRLLRIDPAIEDAAPELRQALEAAQAQLEGPRED